MFPQLRQRFGPALDLLVEFSTLGEYRLDADGVLCPASALAHAPERAPQLGGAGDPVVARAAVRRIVAGGAVGLTPAATPAARRAAQAAPAGRPPRAALTERAAQAPPVGDAARTAACPGERRRHRSEQPPARPKPRPRVAAAPEQLCLAV